MNNAAELAPLLADVRPNIRAGWDWNAAPPCHPSSADEHTSFHFRDCANGPGVELICFVCKDTVGLKGLSDRVEDAPGVAIQYTYSTGSYRYKKGTDQAKRKGRGSKKGSRPPRLASLLAPKPAPAPAPASKPKPPKLLTLHVNPAFSDGTKTLADLAALPTWIVSCQKKSHTWTQGGRTVCHRHSKAPVTKDGEPHGYGMATARLGQAGVWRHDKNRGWVQEDVLPW